VPREGLLGVLALELLLGELGPFGIQRGLIQSPLHRFEKVSLATSLRHSLLRFHLT
jgi:hypothetical protein